jgi:O-antigen/teichoic acid export membrane protein
MLVWNSNNGLPIAPAALAPSSTSLLAQTCTVMRTNLRTLGLAKRSQLMAVRNACKPWRTHALGLADQAFVSGASFLTTVLISHWTSPSQLGLYAIGISALASIIAIQDSLICLPYTILRHDPSNTSTEHAGSALMHCGLLSALCVIVLSATTLSLSAGNTEPALTAMTWALAGAAPFVLLRDFARRIAFAHLHLVYALILDIAVAIIQLVVLCWLGWIGLMSPAKAYAAIGGACALTSIAWLYLARGDFVIRADQVWPSLKKRWNLGKWLFALQITVSVQVCIPYWLLAFGAGTTATGIYAACMSIALFANPLMIGVGNTLAPKASLALKQGGYAKLRREVARDLLFFGATMTLFCLVLVFAGNEMMRLLYHGNEYAGHGETVIVLAFALLASAVGMPASNALQSIQRPEAVFWASLVGAVLTVVLVWFLMIEWGLSGAAYGFLLGNVAGSVGRWVAFQTLIPPSRWQANTQVAPKQNWATLKMEGAEQRRVKALRTNASAQPDASLAGSS